MTNLDSVLKSRDITLPAKIHLVKAVVFPVVMYWWESWTVKKAEHQRIDAFWAVVLEKTLKSPLDCKKIQPVHSKGDQSWVFIGRTDVEAETPIIGVSIIGHLMWRADSLEKTPMLGNIEGRRRRGQQRMRGWMASPAQWTWIWMDSRSWWWTGRPGVLRFMGSQRVGHDWATEMNWTGKGKIRHRYIHIGKKMWGGIERFQLFTSQGKWPGMKAPYAFTPCKRSNSDETLIST